MESNDKKVYQVAVMESEPSNTKSGDIVLQTRFASIPVKCVYRDFDSDGTIIYEKEFFRFITEYLIDKISAPPQVLAISSAGERVLTDDLVSKVNRWFKIVENKYARNSVISLNSDLSEYFDICKKQNQSPFFIIDAQIATVINIFSIGRKSSTISRFINSVSRLLSGCGLHNPTNDELVKAAVKKIKNTIGEEQNQAAPLTLDLVKEFCNDWQNNSNPKELRDMLVISLLFECILRRSELINVKVTDFGETPNPAGGSHYSLLITRLKTDRTGKEIRALRISKRCWGICQKYVLLCGLESGSLIRSFKVNGKPKEQAISKSGVDNILKSASKTLNLPANALLSSHSGRVGAIQALVKGNTATALIQLNAGLKSATMVSRYSRRIDGENLPMAAILNDSDDE